MVFGNVVVGVLLSSILFERYMFVFMFEVVVFGGRLI